MQGRPSSLLNSLVEGTTLLNTVENDEKPRRLNRVNSGDQITKIYQGRFRGENEPDHKGNRHVCVGTDHNDSCHVGRGFHSPDRDTLRHCGFCRDVPVFPQVRQGMTLNGHTLPVSPLIVPREVNNLQATAVSTTR